MREQLALLVHVHTWGSSASYEFAHFSDTELADALATVGTLKRDTTIEQVGDALQKQRSKGKPSLTGIGNGLVAFDKIQLADYC